MKLAVAVLALLAAELGAASPALPRLPASFAGEIPGAGGAMRWHVDLMPDGRYRLRQHFVGQPEPNRFDDIGRWRAGASGRIELRGTHDASLYFEPTPQGLRMLDAAGQRTVSATGHNDLLARLPRPVPLGELRFTATGMFRYLADAASLTLCADGQRLPVAMEGDYRALETAYLDATKAAPGQPILVSFQGTIAARVTGEESRGPQPALVVERFGKFWPRESCGTPLADSPLRNTYWKLTRLNGGPALAPERRREPHLILDAQAARVRGSDGCNRLTGGFDLDGERLRFSRPAGTLRVCPDGAGQDQAFNDALARVERWRVRGSHLELFDAQGQVLTRFESVALK